MNATSSRTLLAVLIVAGSMANTPSAVADVCTNPAPDWKFDWEYSGIKRYYKITDNDKDGRFETVSLRFHNTTGKRMKISFVWKARYLNDSFTNEVETSLILEGGGISSDQRDLTISIGKPLMKSSNTCFPGFYADRWLIRETK